MLKSRLSKIKVPCENLKDKYCKRKSRMHKIGTQKIIAGKIGIKKTCLIQLKWGKEGKRMQRQSNVNSKQNKMAQ